jgi:hypothetical protein
VDAYSLCECGVDPELAEIGILLQTSYCVDRLQIDLANALGTAALFVLETRASPSSMNLFKVSYRRYPG